ncbi:hypothetical protein C0989_006190 [Termitomyces sp. Mn162]|nr:hypothetical protein C0989_006190 [Termitomyces sp. Mn162]
MVASIELNLTWTVVLFAGLNAVRCISIISLILVFASTVLVMVHNIEAVNAFLGHADTSDAQNLSEIGWPAPFFDQYFPVLGQGFGLGALGIFQCLHRLTPLNRISTQILSHHVDDFTLVSAFFLFSIGCVNMLLGLIFRESAKKKRSISAFRAETKPVLPTHTGESTFSRSAFVQHQFTGEKDFPERPDTAEFNSWKYSEKAGYGFGRQGEKAAGLRGFILQKPEESLPRYASPTPPSQNPQHEEPHASLSRAPSVLSSSSSFASPHHENTRTLSAGGAQAPSFKSSPTAL